jgi:hypothetical protein
MAFRFRADSGISTLCCQLQNVTLHILIRAAPPKLAAAHHSHPPQARAKAVAITLAFGYNHERVPDSPSCLASSETAHGLGR